MNTAAAGLFGRDREFAAVESMLAAAAGNAGRVVVVSAGAGAGKTALLGAAVERAQREGFTVLSARGSSAERGLPFGLVGRLFEPARSELAKAEPALDLPLAVDRRQAGPGDEASLAELWALHRALAQLAAQGPVLLAVDDLHWLDRQSLHWLSSLPQRIEHARVAVLLTVCPGEPSTDPAILDELLAASAVELHPAALAPAAVAALLEGTLGAPVDADFLAAAMRQTAGNPLCVTDLAAVLHDQAVKPSADAAPLLEDLAVPRLAARVHARLRRISPHALDTVRAVAVLGSEAELGRIAGICGVQPPQVMEVMTALSQAGLLRVAGRSVTFAQPLLRTTLLHQAPFADLQSLRTRAARVLRATGASDDRVAEQLMAAPTLAEPWAAGVLREAAGVALSRGEPEAAAAYLGRALSEPMPDTVRTPLLAELGRVEGYTDLHAAIRHLTAIAGQFDATAREGQYGVVRQLAELLTAAGRHQAAVELLGTAPESAPTDHALSLAEAQFASATTAEAAAELLARLPRPVPKGGVDEGRYLSLLAMRTAWTGRSRAQAVALAHQALAALPVMPETMQSVLRSVLVLGQAGRSEDAYERADALVGHAERWQHRLLLGVTRSLRGEFARRLGRMPAAIQDARGALDLLLGYGAPRHGGAAVQVLARLVEILVDQGEHDEAAALIADFGLSAEVPESWAGTALLRVRGRLRLAAGQPAEGLRDLLAAASRLPSWNVENPAVAPWRSAAAVALLLLGEAAEARRLAADAVDQARRWGAPGPLGSALRAQGAILGGSQGLATLKESVRALERSTAKLDLASSLTEYGTALGRAKRVVPARRVLRAALDLAEECGCTDLARRSRMELTALGGRPPKTASRGGVADLTAAELRTAMLAAKGKTNRELAEILQVRQRTVEIHLTNAYRKLGIAGREQLPAVLQGRSVASTAAR